IVESYIEFLDKTHKGTLGEIRRILTEEKVELAGKLAEKERALADARHSFGDIGLRSGSRILSPAVQAVVFFNESLIKAQGRRAELEASRAAVMAAVRNGENLQQHVMALADVVGKERLLGSLGFGTRDSHMLADMERRLIEDRSLLRTMLDDLGPSHPAVISKTSNIRMAEQYLAGHQGRIKDRIAQIQNDQLGPLLVQMVQQRLDEAVQLEASLGVTLKDARAKAVALNGQLTKLESLEHDRQWLLNLRDALADRIANIELAHDGQEIRTALIGEPKVCQAPVCPSLSYVSLITMALSLALGLALVYVLDILDDRFRSVEELQGQLGLPVLAMVRQMNTTNGTGPAALQVCTAPTSAESEAFRTLRTALELADAEARRIVISSAQSGDGKTTVLANLAASYAQAGKKALLIDGDLRRPGMTTMMGMRGMDGLSGVIRGKGDVAEAAKAAIRASGVAGMDILSSGPRSARPAELLANPRFSELLSWAETVYEQIFIDSPPLLATSDTAVIGRLVDGVILVVQPDKNRRRLVMRTIETLTTLNIPLLGVVANCVGSNGDRGYYGYGQGYGYGYEVSDEYGNEEPTATEQTDQQTGKKIAPPAGTIPRRVA
ncbi:MAG: polysaccharide biosynthesis tyrosine autokinase, partial [Thermoguttaceae bacterium]